MGRGIGDRVKEARKARGYSMPKLAKAVGISYQTIQGLEKGASVGSKHIIALARELRVRPEWLEREDGDMDLGTGVATLSPSIIEVQGSEFAAIARYDAALSAGPGSIIDPNAEPLGYHLIERQWLRIVTTAAPDQLAILRVAGESMMPTLADGDWVLIDRTQRSFAREGIYALQVMDQAWVKRLSLNLREKLIRIISDNPVVPMQEESEENLHIIGKVVALVARRVP